MKISRRKFLKISALAGGALLLPMPFRWLGNSSAYAFNQSPGIPLFGTVLRGVGPGGIPVALPTPGRVAPITRVPFYNINIQQFDDQIVPVSSGLGPTTLWGYVPTVGLGGNTKPTHLGGIVIGQKGEAIQLAFQNKLFVKKHILPVDMTQLLPGEQAINRTAIHLHGGLVPWISDGSPFAWFDANGHHGPSFLNNTVLAPDGARNIASQIPPAQPGA
jgi:spore coat protein A